MDILELMMEECITPNAAAIAEIVETGEVAVVVFQPDETGIRAVRAIFGLASGAPLPTVARMPGPFRRHLIDDADSVTARWLRGGRTGRVFLVCRTDTLLLNFENGVWSIEPGSEPGAESI